MFDNGSGSTGTCCGTFYQFNNTLACGSEGSYNAGCISGVGGNAFPSGAAQSYLQNNHFITSGTPFTTCGSNCTTNGNLQQSSGTANANTSPHWDRYAESESYAYSPVASSNSTVGTGANNSAFCKALGSFPQAQAACASDTPYAVGYNQTTHTVVLPNRATASRPASSAWDIGAYQLGGSDPGPTAPTNLSAVVNN
jgi:hypothetical protein